VFGIVVVPRNAIVTEEREQLIAILFKPLFEFRSHIADKIRVVKESVEALNLSQMLS